MRTLTHAAEGDEFLAGSYTTEQAKAVTVTEVMVVGDCDEQ